MGSIVFCYTNKFEQPWSFAMVFQTTCFGTLPQEDSDERFSVRRCQTYNTVSARMRRIIQLPETDCVQPQQICDAGLVRSSTAVHQ
jgi:hypothetical protein